MKLIVFVSFAIFFYIEIKCENEREIYDLNNGEDLFEDYIVKFDRHYETIEEKEYRYNIFLENLKEINRINSDTSLSWWAGINDFTDKTTQEVIGNGCVGDPDDE